MPKQFYYATNCTLIPMHEVDDMQEMMDGNVQVSLGTFRRRCEMEGIESDLGYSQGPERGLHLKDDYHVSYHKGQFKGADCYYLTHSAIEHIFLKH